MGAALETEAILREGGNFGFSRLEACAEGTVDRIQEKNGSRSAELTDVSVKVGKRGEEQRLYRLKRMMAYLPDELEWQGTGKEEHKEQPSLLLPGMKLYLEGTLDSFEPASNEGEFDYRLYYRSKDMCCRMNADCAVVTGDETSPFKTAAFLFRERAKAVFAGLCSEKDAGVLTAAVLGDKTKMDEEINTLYQKNGIAHLLAVSGLHVSLIGMGFYSLLRRLGLGFGKAGICAGGLLLFYGVMTGFGPSVFRACLMLACSFLASFLGKTYDLLSAMALAAILLAFKYPFVIFTGAFQLSFGAVAAIGWAGKELSDGFGCGGGWKKALAVSISIQLVTGPLVLYHFFEYPFYGILLNFLVIPLMAYVVGAGLAGLFLGFASEMAGGAAASGFIRILSAFFSVLAEGSIGTCHYILVFYEKLCLFAEKLPGSSLVLGRPQLWKMAVYYLFLFLLLLQMGKRGREKAAKSGEDGKEIEERPDAGKKAGINQRKEKLKGAALLTFLVIFLVYRPLEALRVDFIDVGQGDGILIQEGRSVILVDAGSSQIRNLGEKRLEPVLKSRGISRIDMAFVSHGDQDHISGLAWLLEQDGGIQIEALFLPAAGKGDSVYEELEKTAKKRGTRVEYINAGRSVQEGKLKLTCLYPFKGTESPDRNGHSEILLAEYGGFSMLLMGDAPEEAEKLICENWPPGRRIQVLKAGHHGSSTSSCSLFLDTVKPEFAVFSCGRDNSYGHPHQETVERMKQREISMWSTAQHGMITVKTDGKQMEIKGFTDIYR